MASLILCVALNGCAAPVISDGGLFARATAESGATRNTKRGLTVQDEQGSSEQAVHREVDRAQAATEEALAQVLDDLEEIRGIDRRAQQRLVTELKKSPTHKWPQMVHQFRSALEHREELRQQLLEPSPTRGRSPADDGDELNEAWRTAAQRARIAAPDEESETQPWSEALLTPANMPDADDPAAVFASLPPSPPRAESAASAPSRGDQSVRQAVFLSDADDGPTEPAIWQKPVERSLSATLPSPVRLPKDLSWEQHLSAAVRALAAAAEGDPQQPPDPGSQVRLRLLQLAAEDTDAAMAPILSLSSTEQGFWTSQLFALATYTDGGAGWDGEQRATVAAKHLDDALGQLRQLSSLRVHNLAFCEKVYDYGAYDVCDMNRFSAGRQVTLYTEVENYRSRSTEKGFHTSLASSYEVVDEQGERIAGGDFPRVEDYCRNRRRDFHIQYTLPVPRQAPPGNYRLKLTVVDNLSGKQGQNTIDFQISDSAATGP